MSAYANTYLIEQQAGIDWGTVLPPMSSLYTQEQPVVSVSTACREIHQYEQDRPEPAADRERELALVRATYMFADLVHVESFLHDHRAIAGLLLEAAPYLKRHFGATVTLLLKVGFEDDGSRTLQVLAVWSGALRDAKNALAEFDREWWLQNVRRGSGNIILDYELV
ncbi:MAG TPA: hypothetical protein VKG65_00730 [Terriglobales bacterium]|nr:hypothetical protein [Terriglobales bacterium]